jgi:site-specific DNA-cytosine methylase
MPTPAQEKTPEELDAELMRELEQKIDKVIELLESQKTREETERNLAEKSELKRKHTGNQELAWLSQNRSKKKRIAVTQHAQSNLDLIDAWQEHQKFMEHPKDLLRHLERLTDKLLEVVQRCALRNKKIALPAH